MLHSLRNGIEQLQVLLSVSGPVRKLRCGVPRRPLLLVAYMAGSAVHRTHCQEGCCVELWLCLLLFLLFSTL